MVIHPMRMGEAVWDIAVGDEGNVYGSYLIDPDYTYSPVGKLRKYLQALAFTPSYISRESFAPDRRSVIRSCISIKVLWDRRSVRICSCCRIESKQTIAHAIPGTPSLAASSSSNPPCP
ncbi:uncharacterized protein LACBIDRAFT_313359 [Laccaria bicolor S238N-H82]|uniref:Predicted protein n=1 Tax=Laccaria bicolor (strain S238N-H82 / ATCC MYA-4686) TaxID=486041 RepID=B0DY55_LACBS|nr:uncharacterized protein LACBIDRAFT_313359 [Laccaria bicolor S238N-H82]EDR00462.1 predicted protein [Laccaria bicolor S238N-H82]|eukprot:XP_001888854.1 predicted protein [Laccaria bicolor S238N-H82]